MKALCAAALLLLAGCATAGQGVVSDTAAIPVWKNFEDKPRGYLGDNAPRAETFLAPPPAPGSPREIADRAVYQAMAALKDTPRWRAAQRDADAESPKAPNAFACALGVTLEVQAQPILTRLLLRASTDSDASARAAKTTYPRPRPFLADDGDICIAKEEWLIHQSSYPSGHTATGWLWGLILSELAPDRVGPLMTRARSFGESRIVCRVHFPSDAEAGRAVAAATLSRLQTDPVFQADMITAGKELARARQSGPKPAACDAQAVLDDPAY